MIEFEVVPTYSHDHDCNNDEDLQIQFKIEDLRGIVTECSRWRMIAQLPEDTVGSFLIWASENSDRIQEVKLILNPGR